ncbi:replication protein [Pasteurella multocida]|uniref:replication protein n=1 Tax=Pasteurella multocida TaxID=747 RepID=UPI001F53BB4D|nr:replication protein [Pasteurella multocida]
MSKFIPNSFQVPNGVIDDLMSQMSGAELKCYLAVIRKTKGWNKEEDAISITQLMEVTGLSNRKVIDACNSLVEIGLLNQKTGARNTKIFSINWCKKFTSEESSLVKKVHGKCEESSLVTSEESSHTKNNIKNTPINNINTAQIENLDELENAFDVFWKVYKVKVNKAGALKSFKSAYKKYSQKAKCTAKQFAQMLADDVQKRLSLGQFGFDKLHPTTYLNNARWEDEYTQPAQFKGSQSANNSYQDDGSWAVNSVIVQDGDGKVRVVDRDCEVVL